MPRKGEQGLVAMRKAYKKRYGSVLSTKAYSLILTSFNKKLLCLVLRGVEVKLPHRVGHLYVEKKKVNYEHLGLDYGHWRKTGEKLFHTNRHSDGFIAHYHWRKMTAVFTNRTIYKLTMCRAACRQLAAIMLVPNQHKQYQEYVYPTKSKRATTTD